MSRMELVDIRHAHFVGVGGIGVSAILRFFAGRGITVSGSDIALPPDGALPSGTYYTQGQDAKVPEATNILIYSPAVPETNSERKDARERGIPELSYPEALALVSAPFNTIAVSGTHGKSTTTAILGKLFESGGFDPTVIVGAEVPGWDRNLRAGKGDLFVVEACEYRRHMLKLSPQAIVLTNLELDHPDYYVDLADIKSAFREYVRKLSGDNLLITNADDANLREIAAEHDGITVTYGIGQGPDLVARGIRSLPGGQEFELLWKGASLGTITTTLPGLYNVYNILAASAAYLAYGGASGRIRETLAAFTGIGRRFEEVGRIGRATVISDYAHHPTALQSVVLGAKERFPGKDILVVFRPHQRERTKVLFNDFVSVFRSIEHLVLVEIYDVAGREEGKGVNSEELLDALLRHSQRHDALYAKDLDAAENIIRERADDFDVIVIVGAGDADQLAKRVATRIE